MDAPLDFENEDPLFISTAPTKKRKKVIGLDDLLQDFYKEQSKNIEKESKRRTSRKCYNSDDDDDTVQKNKEASLSRCFRECEKTMQDVSNEDEFPLWGLPVFGNQKATPPLVFSELGRCKLLESFMNSKENSFLELSAEKEETLLQRLLINGWISKLVFVSGDVEAFIAIWAFNLMLYSSSEELRSSACDFWCSILPSKNEVDPPSIRIDWFPSAAELKKALEIYGYVLDSSIDISSLSDMAHGDSGSKGPPQNIRYWIKFLLACFRIRGTGSIFSTSEAQEFLCIIICLFLDRRLQGLSLLLYDCMQSIISFFEDKDWKSSCEKTAEALAYRMPKDLNCLRIVECISGVDTRSKHLRSEISFQILINCFDPKVKDMEEILKLLLSINVKDKSCDLFKMYVYLVLTENWLFSDKLVEDKPVILEMWGVYLRNCSCQITSTDLRSYASKVRNRASYLLQSTMHRRDYD
ncbi:PREDICTED: uncharacterized protein LOC104587350 isoform X2 [Nelumbo nucifera]|uniref:Uncharacterized protein LOC104587350 isoform X2 n=1 Tax=Nelumbo nucifera TaxID=4432 RepID=A0A1U7YYM1_NELNU|nr:PREDICTED: uncharacterized protein LOC104587350 isoform X2 [Nelumbo nucifera]